MLKISRLFAREILDSRGNPTIEVIARSKDTEVRASVPAGMSKSKYEAKELRDPDKKRYQGRGVARAVDNVNKIIAKKLVGKFDISRQDVVDKTLIALDGTPDKSRLGANAILGVSLACAKLAAAKRGWPLYKYVAAINKNKRLVMPVPFANIINGGAHAGNNLEFQEFMLAPAVRSFREATQLVDEVYFTLRNILREKYGRTAVNVGDEGGFAPPIDTAEQALELINQAIEDAGYGKKVKIAIDAAASDFYHSGYYMQNQMSPDQFMTYYEQLLSRYSVVSIEDPFDQDDHASWRSFGQKFKMQIVGDDLLATNTEKIAMAAKERLCNALLLKVNQIGTLTEAMEAANLAVKNRWKVMVSHRSGETNDDYIADIAVGLGNGQIKCGPPVRGERVAKYNRLLEIEESLKNPRYGRI